MEATIIGGTLGGILLCGIVAWFIGSRLMRGLKLTDPVRGKLTVIAASLPPDDAHASNYRLNGVVTGPGLAPTAVTKSGMARVSKWPAAGEVLPIEFERGEPSRFNFLWDEIETGEVQGRRAAERAAAMMGGDIPTENGIDLTGKTDIGATLHDFLRSHGRKGQATVTAVEAEALPDGATRAILALRIEPGDGAAAYETAVNFHFVSGSTTRRDFFCRLDAAFPVLISADDPESVMPDFEAMSEELRSGR
jgi:hypothetical protein